MADTLLVINEENDDEMAIYNSLGYPTYAIHYISSIFVDIEQLKTNLNVEHHQEKQELIRLNNRMHWFVDSIHQLQLQNAQYIAKLADVRRHFFDAYTFDLEEHGHHIHLQADLMAVSHTKINYEFEFELFQMQSEIYKQLIDIAKQSNDKQHLKLKQELDHSSSILINLRKSYEELQKNIHGLKTEHGSISEEYLKVSSTWSHSKKLIGVLKVNVQALQNQLVFYKDIHLRVKEESFSVQVFDAKQFWASKWEGIIANIRHDYELLYKSIHCETDLFYKKKTEDDKQAMLKRANYYQEFEMERWKIVQHTLQTEIEEAQTIYIKEKETLMKLEAKWSKLELELKSIRLQNSERFEEQSTDLKGLDETVTSMVGNLDEIRQKKISLEGELIIYRRLLEIYDESREVIIEPDPLIRSTTMRTFVVERLEVASIGIECPRAGPYPYISLMNHSTSKDIDVSRWILERRIDSKTGLKYMLPDGVQILAGGELRIYSKSGAETAVQLLSNEDILSHPLRKEIVIDNSIPWEIGDKVETYLFNENGEEKASYIQTISSEETVSI